MKKYIQNAKIKEFQNLTYFLSVMVDTLWKEH